MRPTDANNKTHYKNGLENWYRGKRHHFSWGAVQFDAEPSYFIETSTLPEIFVQIFVRFFHAPFFFEIFHNIFAYSWYKIQISPKLHKFSHKNRRHRIWYGIFIALSFPGWCRKLYNSRIRSSAHPIRWNGHRGRQQKIWYQWQNELEM